MVGADSGAIVVFLGPGLQRMESPSSERGLPLIWRAGPAGTPAGGAGVSEIAFTFGGRHDRPWSPAHLRCRPCDDGGFNLTWLARTRLDGDRWDGEPATSDPSRYRVRLLDGETLVRAFETGVEAAVYPAADAATDFPGGMANAAAAVAQWGDGYGWGAETRVRLA
jgi:hypothetical protein